MIIGTHGTHDQILKSLHYYGNTWNSWDSCTMCFSFSLSVNVSYCFS